MATMADNQYYKSVAEMLDALPERVVRYKLPELTILYCNAAWAAGYRSEASEMVGRTLDEFLTRFEAVVLRSHLALLNAQNPISSHGSPPLRGNLRLRPLLSKKNPHFANGQRGPHASEQWVDWVDRYLPCTDGGDGAEILAVGRDATGRHVAEQNLVDSEARFRDLADKSADVVWRFYREPTPHFDYMSPSVESVLGYTPEVFLTDFPHFLGMLDDDSRAMILAGVAGSLPPARVDLRFRCADGHIVIAETMTTPILGGQQGISRDVTELRQLQENLASLSLRDPLTGLANRRLLNELLGQALARSKSSGRALAVAFLDLDDFKTVNDTYGHDAGDIVLCETARRLMGAVRSGDVIARLGGDEFVIVYEPEQPGVPCLVPRIEAALAAPIAVSATASVCCPASIGIADALTARYDAADLIAAADAAMYEVKKTRGRPRHGLILQDELAAG